MKYTQDEQLEKIMARGDELRKKKERRVTGILAASATALTAFLVICIGAIGKTGQAAPASAYGSFLLNEKAGGYVLVAVLAFALGAVITGLILVRRRRGR